MSQLSYSFCMSMLHSLWQAGLMWVLFLLVEHFFIKQNSPLEKRNLLFTLIAAQLLLFISTFFIYHTAAENNIASPNIMEWVNRFLPGNGLQSAAPTLFIIYLFILGYNCTKAMYTWRHFKKQYLPGIQKPPIDLKLFTVIKAHHFGIKRKVSLWLSTTINTPVTFGFFKPVILLPVALLNNIDLLQAETLVLHELSHIKTNDYLLNWFLVVSENIFFFNPFVAFICKRIRLEREKFCDINVLAFEYSPALYAEALLEAERTKKWKPLFQLAAVSRKNQLLERISFFSKANTTRKPKPANILAPALGVLIMVLLFSALMFRTTGFANNVGNTKLQLNAVPFSNLESVNPIIANNVTPVISPAEIGSISAEINKPAPFIEKKLKKMEPMLSSREKKAHEIDLLSNSNFPLLVNLNENNAGRQIIINEESSSGIKSVKVFNMSFVNGKWVIKPEWMALAKMVLEDSLLQFWDSTVKKELQQQ